MDSRGLENILFVLILLNAFVLAATVTLLVYAVRVLLVDPHRAPVVSEPELRQDLPAYPYHADTEAGPRVRRSSLLRAELRRDYSQP